MQDPAPLHPQVPQGLLGLQFGNRISECDTPSNTDKPLVRLHFTDETLKPNKIKDAHVPSSCSFHALLPSTGSLIGTYPASC